MNIPNSHILYLKTLPNQGQDDKLGGLGTGGKKVKSTAAAMNDLNEQFKKTTSQELIKQVKDQFSGLLSETNQLTVGINKLVGQQEALGRTFITLAKESTFFEQRNRELNKTLGINSETAGKLGAIYDDLSEGFKTGGKQIRVYAQELNKLLPLNAKNIAQSQGFGKELLRTAKLFRENLGLSGEVVNGFARFSAGIGDVKTDTRDVAAQLVSFVKPLEEETGLLGTTRAILSDVASLSSDVQLQFRNTGTAIGLAVLKTRMLGTSLGEVFSIGKNLLNIEQSVGNELEFQLLSGRRLVNEQGESLTQKFREATLMGDANAAADAMNEILETQGDVISDNLFARQKLAETLGISEEKLAGMVQQRQLLEKAGPQAERILKLQGEELAVELGKFRKEATKDEKDALDALMEDRANQLTTDEKMLYYLETLTTGLLGEQVALAGETQAQLIKDQQDIFANMGNIETVTDIGNLVTGGATDQQLVNILGAFGEAANLFTATAESLSATAGVVPIANTVIQAISQKLSDNLFSGINKINATTVESINVGTGTVKMGGKSDPDVGDFISRPGGETISFSSKDTVVGAKAGGPIDQMLAMAGGGGASIDYNAMAAAVASAMSNIQIVAPTDIYRDSDMNIQPIT